MWRGAFGRFLRARGNAVDGGNRGGKCLDDGSVDRGRERFDRLDLGPAFRLEDGKEIYGQGIWAPTFRYYKGTYYIFANVNRFGAWDSNLINPAIDFAGTSKGARDPGSIEIEWWRRGHCCRRRPRRGRCRRSERRAYRPRNRSGISATHDVHVHHMGSLAAKMIVNRGLLDTACLQRPHDRNDFILGKNKIAHHQ